MECIKLSIDAVPDSTNNQVQIIGTLSNHGAGIGATGNLIEQSIANLPDLDELEVFHGSTFGYYCCVQGQSGCVFRKGNSSTKS